MKGSRKVDLIDDIQLKEHLEYRLLNLMKQGIKISTDRDIKILVGKKSYHPRDNPSEIIHIAPHLGQGELVVSYPLIIENRTDLPNVFLKTDYCDIALLRGREATLNYQIHYVWEGMPRKLREDLLRRGIGLQYSELSKLAQSL